MTITSIKNFLSHVGSLNSRYKKINELTGENFNVFRILKLESSEVRMHSAFIAELLDPQGSHGQKDAFLNLFIKLFCFRESILDSTTCNVEIEKHAGFISEDKTEGGRLDIFIGDRNNNHIIIENKIYAGDQPKQLLRYNKRSPNAHLLYLTLWGKDPDKSSSCDLIKDIHFKCISYKVHIVEWLELCRKEATMHPIIRESITQYINLIKYLTNQTLNHNMQEELSELMSLNLEESIAIADNINNALDKVSDNFGALLKAEMAKIGLECYYRVNFKKNFSGIYINKPEWKYLNIAFQFQGYDKELIYGFANKIDPNKQTIPLEVRAKLKSFPHNFPKNSEWWPWYNKMESPYDNWHGFGAWKAINDGRMLENFKEKVDYLIKVSDGIDL